MNGWLLLQGLLGMSALMAFLWLVHLRIKNAAVVDVGWAAGLALLAILYAFQGDGLSFRRIAIACLAGLWGFRLALHLLVDRVIDQLEEGRYRELRDRWKTSVPAKFFVFFQFQAVLDVLLSIPFLLVALNPEPEISAIEIAGMILWALAFAGEAIADRQLRRFKADPANRGHVCRDGLWRYSRHPNYFFEWLIWVSFFLIALPAPHGWIAAVSPLLILFFLFRVTGIPATEAQALRSRGDLYREYQRTTSAFLPWFPLNTGVQR